MTATQEGKTSHTSTFQHFAHIISAKIPLAMQLTQLIQIITGPHTLNLEMEGSPPTLHLSLQEILGLLWPQDLVTWAGTLFLKPVCLDELYLSPLCSKFWVCNYTNSSELFYFASSASLKVQSQDNNYKHLAKRRNTGHLFFCFRRSQFKFQLPLLNVTFYNILEEELAILSLGEKQVCQGKAYCLKRHRRVQRLKDPSQPIWVCQALGFYFELNFPVYLASPVALSEPF